MEENIINVPRMNGTSVVADQTIKDYGFIDFTEVDVNHVAKSLMEMNLDTIDSWNNGSLTV